MAGDYLDLRLVHTTLRQLNVSKLPIPTGHVVMLRVKLPRVT